MVDDLTVAPITDPTYDYRAVMWKYSLFDPWKKWWRENFEEGRDFEFDYLSCCVRFRGEDIRLLIEMVWR